MGQIQLTVALVLIGLFTVAIIGFAVNFAADNQTNVSIGNDAQISSLYNGQNANLTSFSSGAQNQYQSIVQTTISPGSQTAPTTGPFSITPLSAIGIVINIMQVGYIKVFGSNSGFNIFIVALIAVITFMLGLFLYKTLRGFPD